MGRALVAILISLGLVSPASTQSARPDFSGKWVDVRIVNGKEVIEETLVITQDDKGLTSRSYSSNGIPGEQGRFVFGEATVQKTPPGTEGTATSTWKGSALFVVMTVKVGGEARAVYEQVWSIDAATNLVIESTRKPTSGPPVTSKTVFRRQ